MKAKQTILAGGVACGTLAILGGLFVPDLYVRNASADMQVDKTMNVQFTFDSTLSMTLEDGGNLVISDLAPGVSRESAPVTIKTKTNNATGYVLSAKVGGKVKVGDDGGELNFTSTNLVASEDTISAYFESIQSANAVLGNGEWGYKVGSDTDYKGFADTATAVVLKQSSTASLTADEVKFRIGAHAATGQPSGTYQNVITFTSTANVTTN